MMVQCWLAAGVFVEVYVSVLIRCQWDAGPVWRWRWWTGGYTSEAVMDGDGFVVF